MKKLPLYIYIKDYLTEIINANKNVADFKLPTESQLSLKFNASRVTVRSALEALEKKNMIFRIRGRGTFINNSALVVKGDKLENMCMIVPNTKTKFINEIINGSMAFCKQNKITLILSISEDNIEMESLLIENFLSLNCKGLIIDPVDYEIFNNELTKLCLQKFPLVLIDKKLKRLNISSVTNDHYGSLFAAIKHLTKDGFKNITYINNTSDCASSVEERNNAFEHAMLECRGLIRQSNIIFVKSFKDEKIEKIYYDFLIQNPQTEAFVINSANASPLINTVNLIGGKIAENMRYLLFDDEICDFPNIRQKAYTILQDTRQIGYDAAELLYNQINGNFKILEKKLPAKLRTPDGRILELNN